MTTCFNQHKAQQNCRKGHQQGAEFLTNGAQRTVLKCANNQLCLHVYQSLNAWILMLKTDIKNLRNLQHPRNPMLALGALWLNSY